jgi:AbiU2
VSCANLTAGQRVFNLSFNQPSPMKTHHVARSKTVRIPTDVADVFEALSQVVTFLHGTWDVYRQLFGTPEAVEALNGVAPGGFRVIQYIVRREAVMGICRVTDRLATGSRENLTLRRLLHVIEQSGPDQAFLDRLHVMLDHIDIYCAPFVERRNREFGHLDLATALPRHPTPLPAIEIEQFETAIRLIAEFMNEVLGYYRAAHRDFVPHVTGPASNIVHAMREFKRLQQADHERQVAELQSETANQATEAKG